MLAEAAEKGERAKRGETNQPGRMSKITTSDIGVSRDQSSKWQAVAKLTDAEFEDALQGPERVGRYVALAYLRSWRCSPSGGSVAPSDRSECGNSEASMTEARDPAAGGAASSWSR